MTQPTATRDSAHDSGMCITAQNRRVIDSKTESDLPASLYFMPDKPDRWGFFRSAQAVLRSDAGNWASENCMGCSSAVTTWQPKRRSKLTTIGARKLVVNS